MLSELFSCLPQLCNVNGAQICVLQDLGSGDAQTLSIMGLISEKRGPCTDVIQAVKM